MRLSTTAAKFIFATTAIVIVTISFILYQQVKHMINSREQLNITNLVKLKLEGTLSALKDAESAQRGFLITHDSVFLEPFQGAYDRTLSLISEVRNLTSDDPVQMNNTNKLETLAEVRFKTFNHVIRHFEDSTSNEDSRKRYLMRRATTMDTILLVIQNIADRENAQVESREELSRKYNFLTPFFGILLMVFAIGILVFSYGKIIEQLNRTKKLLYQLKRLNFKLKKKNHELELYNKELDSFTYIASHDLKEPVRKILTYLTLIDKKIPADHADPLRKSFLRIHLSTMRMQNLLNDLMMYSHLQPSHRELEDIDLEMVISEVQQNLAEEIEETGTTIITEDLPVIKGMHFQIKQLFENLINNSIKYRRPQVAPVIRISSRLVPRKNIREKFLKESTHYHLITLSDNGEGFEQQYAEKIFQLFQRLNPHEDKEGTGVGLTICKKIIDNHHGYIKVRSEVNNGTEFEIYLPAQAENPSDSRRNPDRVPETAN